MMKRFRRWLLIKCFRPELDELATAAWRKGFWSGTDAVVNFVKAMRS